MVYYKFSAIDEDVLWHSAIDEYFQWIMNDILH